MLEIPSGCILLEIPLNIHPILRGNNNDIIVYCNQCGNVIMLVPALHTTDEHLAD